MEHRYCCNGEHNASEKKKSVTLIFKRAELLYDVSNYSFVEADILPQDEEHTKHQIFDITQDGNVDRVTRVLNLAHSECVELLYPYVKEEIPDTEQVLDDILREPEEYKIVLSLPSKFSMTTVRMLEHLIHEFLVCRVLADWMSITLPGKTVYWLSKVEELKSKMQTCLMSRVGVIKRKLKPW